MWSNILTEIIFRVIPECMLFIFSGYAFSRYRVQKKRYFLASLFMSFFGYLIARLLPVEFGILQILSMTACATLLVIVIRIPMQKAIASALGIMILGFVAEIIAVVVMALYKGISVQTMFANTELFDSLFRSELERQLYGLFPLSIMAAVLFVLYFMAKAKGKLKDVPA